MRIREATPDDAGGIARVHVEAWRATYRGIMSDEYLGSLTEADRTQKWRKHIASARDERRVVLVACDASGAIAGFIAGGPVRGEISDFDAELYAIYLLPESQRGGGGRALVAELVWALEQRGFRSLLVWVLRDNPARAFYEALGGKLVLERAIEIGAQTLDEVAYGWSDFERVRAPKRGLDRRVRSLNRIRDAAQFGF